MSVKSENTSPFLPGGTVTFLFSDIEGSTKLLHQLGEGYVTLLADHHRLLREVFAKFKGSEVDTEGDAFFVSFPRSTDAVSAVVAAQRAIADYDWPEGVTVRVRMGLHTGEPWTAGEGYVGMDVHRAARIAHVGYGGQVLLSETTTSLVIDHLPEDVSLLDLGRHRLKDMKRPEHIRQLVIEGLPADFPPLKTLGVVAEPAPPEFEPPELPAFLREGVVAPTQPVFVGRERELAWLTDHLRSVLEVQESGAISDGRILFVTGEAGMGKSSLLQAFTRQSTANNPELLVAWGQGNAFSGQGDPYLPFREVFAQLGGDVEGPWRSGLLDREAAGRLWMELPETATILANEGDELLENFLSGKALLRNLAVAAPEAIALNNRIRELVQKDPYASRGTGQQRLFEQVAAVLTGISARRPLLIILDDLQWIDRGSVDLLFQLGRKLSNNRLLIIVAYRPEDVAAGRDSGRHPLQRLVEEFKRLHGDTTLDLAGTEGRSFVDEYVDSEPNRLDLAFRDSLYHRTGGHALFTVELLRDMQERGDLVQDDQGRWAERQHLDWNNLPARVEGVIESRIGRLEESLREILTVAAVEGESFTARVIARIQEIQERKLLRSLSRELDLRHHLVNERQAIEVGEQILARYRFAHALFQRYIYNEISPVERRLLHGEIAVTLEEIYGDEQDTVVFQLARHYLEAGDDQKAMDYFLKAGDQARQLSAYQEAIEAYQSALSLAKAGHGYDKVARILMKLGLSYNLASEFDKASETYREAFVAWQKKSTLEIDIPPPFSDQPLRIEYNDTSTLDPLLSTIQKQRILRQLFSGLVQMSLEGDVIPDVAHRWDILDGGKTYKFHLREDVYWRDGHPVSAYDFEYAWQRVLDSDHYGADTYLHQVRGARAYQDGREQWAEVGIHAEDALTLIVEFEEPTGHFLPITTFSGLFPVPRHVVSEKGDEWAMSENLVSNGPFFLESWSRKRENALALVRNPNYHGLVKGNVGRVVMPVSWTATQHVDSFEIVSYYESNKVDILNLDLLPGEIAEYLIRRFAEDYVTLPDFVTRFLVLNPGIQPFDILQVRQALAMSIDKYSIASDLVGTMHDAAMGGMIPPGMWGHSPDISLSFDPGQARLLLNEAGLFSDQVHPQINALYAKGAERELLYLAKSWEKYLDLHISATEVSFDELVGVISSDPPHLYGMAWKADYQDPNNFMVDALQRIRRMWNRPEFWELIDEARLEQNRSKRLELYQQADRILINEAVLVPLIYRRIHWLVKPWIKNWSFSAFTFPSLENVIIEPH